MGKGTPHSIGGTCGLRLVVYSFLDEHGSTNMGALVSDVWNGIRWDLHPARSEKQVRLMAFISLLSPQDRAYSASWIMDGKVKQRFNLYICMECDLYLIFFCSTKDYIKLN